MRFRSGSPVVAWRMRFPPTAAVDGKVQLTTTVV